MQFSLFFSLCWGHAVFLDCARGFDTAVADIHRAPPPVLGEFLLRAAWMPWLRASHPVSLLGNCREMLKGNKSRVTFVERMKTEGKKPSFWIIWIQRHAIWTYKCSRNLSTVNGFSISRIELGWMYGLFGWYYSIWGNILTRNFSTFPLQLRNCEIVLAQLINLLQLEKYAYWRRIFLFVHIQWDHLWPLYVLITPSTRSWSAVSRPRSSRTISGIFTSSFLSGDCLRRFRAAVGISGGGPRFLETPYLQLLSFQLLPELL